MYKFFKNLVKNIFIGEDNDKDIFDDKIINLNISNNVNISIETPKPEKMMIRKDLFDNNYYYKYLFIHNGEYKFNSLKEAVNKNHIIYKKNLIKSSSKLFKHIYLNNDKIYKSCYYNNKHDYLYIIRYLKKFI